VEWYRGSVASSNLRPGVVTVSKDGDLFNVQNVLTFTPTYSDDQVEFICHSAYVGEPRLIDTSATRLQLDRKSCFKDREYITNTNQVTM